MYHKMVGMNAPTTIIFQIAQSTVEDCGMTKWDAQSIQEWFEQMSFDILTGEIDIDDNKLFEDWQTLVETKGIKEVIDWNAIATSLEFATE